ncbi:alpha/beta fold hydrolase [uncultured Parolsenella sp.]|uniref:alpha/beta hydrolase family protein n=1 Tax=uncultured Parolsenella sp. TaxID=2083008 RepID=UPI0025E0F1C0|nr:alpha/beta fold hydrolase [uncultured Parolsenella sp.]
MQVVEHIIESEKSRIVGDLALPDVAAEKDGAATAPEKDAAAAEKGASTPLPLVIFSHGFNSSGSRGLRFAEAVCAAGFALYGFDFRGGATDSRSDGSPLEMSVATECTDLAEVVDAMATDGRFDERNIFLFGASFGGLVSALVAARMPEKIRGLILHYPGFCIPDVVHAGFATPDDVPETFFALSMDVGRVYALDAWNLDPYAEIAAYQRPVLITHGTADELVDPSYSQRAAAVYDHAELHLIDGASHGFHGPALREATGYLVDYLTRTRA